MNNFGICIESSHEKGMGHFFRAINILDLLKSKRKECVLFINNDRNSVSILKQKKILFEIVNLDDFRSDWESVFIRKYKINIWINDRLDTIINHARNVTRNKTMLVCIDDKGKGAELADINFGSLPLNFNCNLKGKKVFSGLKYLILDKVIDRYKKIRKKARRVLVTLGGSDTYGVTVKVASILKGIGMPATIVTGPLFKHGEELSKIIDRRFVIKKAVPSLVKEFTDYDLAITGGGITPFEANASGLPCIVIANELFEIPNGQFLSKLASSVFAGYHEKMESNVFTKDLNIEKMSKLGMDQIKTSGVDNIYQEINSLWVKP